MNIPGLYSQPQQSPVPADTVKAAPDTVLTKSSLQQSLEQTQPKIAWSISFAKVLWTIILFTIAFTVIKYVTRLLEALSERWTRFRLFLKRVIPVFRISGWTLVIYIIIIGILRPPIQTLVAFTASAGIAIGFASQDILKNIFGGIMILFDRPFQVGDKIQIGSYYGEVRQIGLRTVRIVTPDDSMVSIPNSEIVNQSVSNANSGEFNCQVVAELYLPPDIDLILLKKIAYKAAAVSQYVYLKKPIVVIVKNEVFHDRSWLKVRLKAYVLDIRYEFVFMSEMTENLLNNLLKKGLISPADLGFIRESQG
ncbi:mechanosensitive ion channel [candidate division KSB1 bacterium]|nr:mechanosensitive ion channel [candidate division KSB1 bacterium]